MPSAYQIKEEIKAILDSNISLDTEIVNTETGEVLSLQSYLDSLSMSLEEKIKNVALYHKERKAFVEGLKAEKKRISDLLDAEKKAEERRIEYLKFATDGKNVEDVQFSIKYKKNPPSVRIAEGAVIPQEFLTIPEPVPNKTMLKKALQGGAVIAGVELEQKIGVTIK